MKKNTWRYFYVFFHTRSLNKFAIILSVKKCQIEKWVTRLKVR